MFCGQCGSSNPEGANFCGRCGKALTPTAPISPTASESVNSASTQIDSRYDQGSKTSGKAVASLICGFLFYILPAAIAAIILGHISLSDIRKSAGRLKGHGIAVAGLVLGYLGLVFIPVILIIAAIAIPNLLRSRMAANEASAVASLRTIDRAAIAYSQTYNNGYPANLEVLSGIGVPSCDHAGLIDGTLASGMRRGYAFTYRPTPGPNPESIARTVALGGCNVPGAQGFSVTADPITRGTTGQRSFFVDETGVIRYDQREPATAASTPLE